MRKRLEQAVATGQLRDLDLHFATFIGERDPAADPAVLLAAALVSQRAGEGDTCLELDSYAGTFLFAEAPSARLQAPELAAWRAALAASGAVAQGEDSAPLVLDGDRLYLARYWHFETRLAQALGRRAALWTETVERERLAAGLARLFGRDNAQDYQKMAAALAVLRPLAVISGGPGTGKTRTVTAILALLLEQQPALRIALAAPTGKAAARLSESIKEAKGRLELEDAIRAAIPEQAATLHRLLGIVPGRSRPRHDAQNPLHADLLVVDEASMVDLPLMARLLEALPPHGRLILLGDKDQLASVEAGAVLADICGDAYEPRYSAALCQALREVDAFAPAPAAAPPLADSVALLRHSYRFGADSGIGELARAINGGDAEAVAAVLEAGRADLTRLAPDPAKLGALVRERILPDFQAVLQCATPAEALARFNRFRVLCALRDGPFGVEELNALITRALHGAEGIDTRRQWYRGRPVMVLRNDYALGLFNGDIGLLWPDADGVLRVWFDAPDGGLRAIHPGRLPEHETVYAMTVHKSQGSEFDRVLLVLPQQEARVLSRELIYTGITRARQAVELWGEETVVAAAVARRVHRASGLRDRLWRG